MHKKELILFIHGFKRQNKNDFEKFVNENKSEIENKEIKLVNYYDALDKETINYKKFDLEVEKIINENQDKKIILVCYSLGSLIGLKSLTKYLNIKEIIIFAPTLFISQIYWWKRLLKNKIKEKKLIKKLGRERYMSLRIKSGELYPSKIASEIRKYISKNRNIISKVNNSKIKITYSINDEISNPQKTISYLIKKLNNTNNVIIEKVNSSHFDILNNKKIENELLNILKSKWFK